MGGEGLAESEEVGEEAGFKADVVAGEAPALVHIAVDCCEGERENTPHERVVQDTDMVRDGEEAASAGLVVGAGIDEVEEGSEAMHFGLVESEEEGARDSSGGEDDLMG